MSHGEDLTEVALSYRKLGLGIVPMRVDETGNKKALARWKSGGLRAARSIIDRFDQPSIAEDVLLAIVTGGTLEGGGYLVAVDADTYKPGIQEALDRLELPETVTSVTPRGGKHFLFRSPKPFASFVRSDGIEVKAVGSLLTMPPGLGSYWLVNDERKILDPFTVEIAPMPDTVFEARTRKYDLAENINRQTFGDLEELCSRVSRLEVGNRSVGLLKIAGVAFSLVRSSLLGEKTTYNRLLESAIGIGLEPNQAERLLSYARDTDKGKARGAYKFVVPVRQREVLGFVKARLENRFPSRDVWRNSDIFSVRYVASSLGISKTTVQKAFPDLVEKRLLWEGDAKRLTPGHRAAHRYGITRRGIDFLNSHNERPKVHS